jgi:hypothetical protein
MAHSTHSPSLEDELMTGASRSRWFDVALIVLGLALGVVGIVAVFDGNAHGYVTIAFGLTVALVAARFLTHPSLPKKRQEIDTSFLKYAAVVSVVFLASGVYVAVLGVLAIADGQAATGVLLLGVAAFAFAFGGTGVSRTWHDLRKPRS